MLSMGMIALLGPTTTVFGSITPMVVRFVNLTRNG